MTKPSKAAAVPKGTDYEHEFDQEVEQALYTDELVEGDVILPLNRNDRRYGKSSTWRRIIRIERGEEGNYRFVAVDLYGEHSNDLAWKNSAWIVRRETA